MGVLTTTIALAFLLAMPPRDAAAGHDSVPEPVARAAVLYNLATYTTWPSERASGPDLHIGVAGPDPILAALHALEGRRVQGRTIRVRELRPEDDLRTCDLIYVPGTSPRGFPLRLLDGVPVLIVGDGSGAHRDLTAVRVTFERARLRLEVELSALDRAGLRISSKVLSLARVLRNGHVVTTSSSRP